ncbi:MAG: uncharacterized protein KVP18_001255 [Porospora cf. gigantea A]|uniref:uncharacterized protein n=1 Tax=Porospora cf. gigantea A TaxID=2853593 RepID=UPI00355A953D|nr:MAG: hypothetical protein KVP18_001255 [Porospora cf. gigantea A]
MTTLPREYDASASIRDNQRGAAPQENYSPKPIKVSISATATLTPLVTHSDKSRLRQPDQALFNYLMEKDQRERIRHDRLRHSLLRPSQEWSIDPPCGVRHPVETPSETGARSVTRGLLGRWFGQKEPLDVGNRWAWLTEPFLPAAAPSCPTEDDFAAKPPPPGCFSTSIEGQAPWPSTTPQCSMRAARPQTEPILPSKTPAYSVPTQTPVWQVRVRPPPPAEPPQGSMKLGPLCLADYRPDLTHDSKPDHSGPDRKETGYFNSGDLELHEFAVSDISSLAPTVPHFRQEPEHGYMNILLTSDEGSPPTSARPAYDHVYTLPPSEYALETSSTQNNSTDVEATWLEMRREIFQRPKFFQVEYTPGFTVRTHPDGRRLVITLSSDDRYRLRRFVGDEQNRTRELTARLDNEDPLCVDEERAHPGIITSLKEPSLGYRPVTYTPLRRRDLRRTLLSNCSTIIYENEAPSLQELAMQEIPRRNRIRPRRSLPLRFYDAYLLAKSTGKWDELSHCILGEVGNKWEAFWLQFGLESKGYPSVPLHRAWKRRLLGQLYWNEAWHPATEAKTIGQLAYHLAWETLIFFYGRNENLVPPIGIKRDWRWPFMKEGIKIQDKQRATEVHMAKCSLCKRWGVDPIRLLDCDPTAIPEEIMRDVSMRSNMHDMYTPALALRVKDQVCQATQTPPTQLVPPPRALWPPPVPLNHPPNIKCARTKSSGSANYASTDATTATIPIVTVSKSTLTCQDEYPTMLEPPCPPKSHRVYHTPREENIAVMPFELNKGVHRSHRMPAPCRPRFLAEAIHCAEPPAWGLPSFKLSTDDSFLRPYVRNPSRDRAAMRGTAVKPNPLSLAQESEPLDSSANRRRHLPLDRNHLTPAQASDPLDSSANRHRHHLPLDRNHLPPDEASEPLDSSANRRLHLPLDRNHLPPAEEAVHRNTPSFAQAASLKVSEHGFWRPKSANLKYLQSGARAAYQESGDASRSGSASDSSGLSFFLPASTTLKNASPRLKTPIGPSFLGQPEATGLTFTSSAPHMRDQLPASSSSLGFPEVSDLVPLCSDGVVFSKRTRRPHRVAAAAPDGPEVSAFGEGFLFRFDGSSGIKRR